MIIVFPAYSGEPRNGQPPSAADNCRPLLRPAPFALTPESPAVVENLSSLFENEFFTSLLTTKKLLNIRGVYVHETIAAARHAES